ncbi:MAG: radical SAM protein [Nitrospirota bacterium]
MKILLISPEIKDSQLRFTKKEAKSFWFPRLSLTTLASFVPQEDEVKIIDETVDNIDFDMDVDLVGISVMTYHAPRAYAISQRFRKRGVTVVLGGIHPSAMPAEAGLHADSVVIGEAEETWPRLIKDFKRGELKPIYRQEGLPSLENLPFQRLDLLKPGAYMTNNCVQTSRGCPHGCDFCSVTKFFGKTYRYRPVKDVIKEVESLPGDYLVFVDDNIAGNRRYAKELFTALKPLKKRWGSQSSLSLANDPELLKLAADSGCGGMFVGIETLSQDNLQGVNKGFNRVSSYNDLIRRFHDNGIMLNAGIIFGFDNDDESVFEKTVDFLIKNHVGLVLFSILTPLPGTGFYKKVEQEGRIIDRDWTHYDGRHIVFKPKLMTPESLQDGFFWTYRQFYSYRSMLKRILHFPEDFLKIFLLNHGYRRMVLRAPEGGLPVIADVLKKLQGIIPVKETSGFIHNTIDSIKDKVDDLSSDVSGFLKIRTRKTEIMNLIQGHSLLVDLEGALDKDAALRLKNMLNNTIKKIQLEIVVNFENLKKATPVALNTLLSNIPKEIKPMNISPVFREALIEQSVLGGEEEKT